MTAPLTKHIEGSRYHKTVCWSYVLAFLGIGPDRYTHTYDTQERRNTGLDILREHGFTVQKVEDTPATMGKLKRALKDKEYSPGLRYIVRVRFSSQSHVILADQWGEVLTDSCPRIRDRRRITDLHLIKKSR